MVRADRVGLRATRRARDRARRTTRRRLRRGARSGASRLAGGEARGSDARGDRRAAPAVDQVRYALILLALVIAALALTTRARAHTFEPSLLELRERQSGGFEVAW